MMRFVLLFCVVCALTSCYRIPQEGEVSTLPTVNNPTLTRQKPGGFPGVDL